MKKSFDLLYGIFNDIENKNTLFDFIAFMADQNRPKTIERCKKEKDREDPVDAAFTEGECAGMKAGFNVGFIYGNMFEVVDPESKEYVGILKKKLIHDGTLMFIPKKRVTKVA